MKKVLLSGNCNVDYPRLARFLIDTFDCRISRAKDNEDAKRQLKDDSFDLVMVNRIGAFDSEPGIDIVHYVQKDEKLKSTPVMLITNYPDKMEEAVSAGAVEGFGKDDLRSEKPAQILKKFLAVESE